MESFKIFLGGFNSTGKTTLIDVLKILDYNIDVCYGSKEFFKWLGLKEGDYNSLEQLSSDYKDFELGKMVSFLIKEINQKIWIFTGHFGRINNLTINPAVGNWISNFNLIVLLTANADTLVCRIKNDFDLGIRNREKLKKLIDSSSNSVEIFNKFLKQTERISENLSFKYKIPLIKLNSSEHNSLQLAEQLLAYINLKIYEKYRNRI